LARGHKTEWIVDGFTRAVMKPRDEALKKSEKKEETKNLVRLVTTFDHKVEVTKGFNKLKKEKRLLESTTDGTYLKGFGLQLAYRNAKNLRRRLVNKSPRVEEVDGRAGGFTRCSKKCAFCDDIKDEKKILKIPEVFWNKLEENDSRRKKLQEIKIPNSSCASKNLVYLCGCTACGIFYVGETGDTLNRRCSKHRSQPTDAEKYRCSGHIKDWSEVRRHLVERGHAEFFWVAPVELLKPEAPERHRKKREAFWIRFLRPVLNVQLRQQASSQPTPRSRSNSATSTGSPPVSPSLRRKLGIPSSIR
jgi:hypothetical protein